MSLHPPMSEVLNDPLAPEPVTPEPIDEPIAKGGQQVPSSEVVKGNHVFIPMKMTNGIVTGVLIHVPEGTKVTFNVGKDGSTQIVATPDNIKRQQTSLDDMMTAKPPFDKINPQTIAIFDYRTVPRGQPDEALTFVGGKGQITVTPQKDDFHAEYLVGAQALLATMLASKQAPALDVSVKSTLG